MHDILKQLVVKLRAEPGDDLIGVLAGGSRLRGESDAHSDLDVVVVAAQPRRRRRNVVIGGVEVEMFINPPFQMRRYFALDRESGRGAMPHLCSTGTIVYDPRGVMAELQAEAAAIWNAGPPPLSSDEQWRVRYMFADMLRDVADVIEADPDRAAYLVGWMLPQIVNTHYRVHRRWLHKPKRVLNDLATWDATAAALARRAVSGSTEEQAVALTKLIEHVLVPLGGLMPLEWQSDWEELQP